MYEEMKDDKTTDVYVNIQTVSPGGVFVSQSHLDVYKEKEFWNK